MTMEAENNISTDGQQGQQQETRNKYLTRLLPGVKQRGFSHMRIDDIVRSMDISKATFYKYFSSKEDVIEQVVELIVSFLRQTTETLGDESSSYMLRFQHAFGQAVLIASYLSDAFLLDLRQVFPPLWERLKQIQRERQQQVQQFYEQGVAAGVFQPVNPILMMLEDELVLRTIMDPAFLMEHDVTLKTMLYDYYILQKYQWLVPEIREQVDDTPVKEYIDMMARKISLGMRSDFVM